MSKVIKLGSCIDSFENLLFNFENQKKRFSIVGFSANYKKMKGN